jgi:exonuclease I
MHSTIHFYDAQFIGSPAQGQLTAFDSVACTSQDASRFSTQISLRPDVAFSPQAIEQQGLFDADLTDGVTEYEWSRKAQSIFEKPNTLHVGLGNTSTIDYFIRYALYRSLSTLPSTELPKGAHFLDLLTISRAIGALRPQSMDLPISSDWSESRKREFVIRAYERESRADSVMEFTRTLMGANPKLLAHAMAHSSPEQIAKLCGLVDGRVESLSTLKPVFICHEQLMAIHKYGLFLAFGTDPQYTNIVYVIDLQSDLTALIEDGGISVGRFIRTDATETDKPIVRLNLNRVPFVCPIGVVDSKSADRLNIDIHKVRQNAALLHRQSELCLSLLEVSGASESNLSGDPDYQLFGSEYLSPDRALIERIHGAPPAEWEKLLLSAHDARITALGMQLIRRCSFALLSEDETYLWQAHCAKRLVGRADPALIVTTKEYCLGIAASANSPKGMRAAALHWLNTIEIGNEPRINV